MKTTRMEIFLLSYCLILLMALVWMTSNNRKLQAELNQTRQVSPPGFTNVENLP